MAYLDGEDRIEGYICDYYIFYDYIIGKYRDEFFAYAKEQMGVFADILFHIYTFEIKYIETACNDEYLMNKPDLIRKYKDLYKSTSDWRNYISVKLDEHCTIILEDTRSDTELMISWDDLGMNDPTDKFIKDVLKQCKLNKKDKQMFLLFRLLADLYCSRTSLESRVLTCKTFIENLGSSVTPLFNLIILFQTYNMYDRTDKIGDTHVTKLGKRLGATGKFTLSLIPQGDSLYADCIANKAGSLVYIVCGTKIALLNKDILLVCKNDEVEIKDYKEYMSLQDKVVKRKQLLSGQITDLIIVDI